MPNINTQNLEQFIREHPIPKQFKRHLRTIGVQSQYKLWEIDAAQICSLSVKINNSLSSKPNREGGNDQSSSSQWKKSELKIYVWMLVFYCDVYGKSIESLVFKILSRFSKTIASSTPSSPPRPPASFTTRPSEFVPLIFINPSNSSGQRRTTICSEGWWKSSRTRGKS